MAHRYCADVREQLVTALLPVLGRRPNSEFNVFEVMRHGTHEKQVSNVFAWLLDVEGTHRLGDGFLRAFVSEVNRALPGQRQIGQGAFSVRQEVNTSIDAAGMDIADLVLEDDTTVLVVENYYISDGHGHSYDGYRRFGARDGKDSIVVMLCGEMNASGLTDGWEHAAVVTYRRLVDWLIDHIEKDVHYQAAHPEQCAFFRHLHRTFEEGLLVNDDTLIGFVKAMCQTGEADRFGATNQASVAVAFADTLREQAMVQYGDSRLLLGRVKKRLRAYGTNHLRGQINAVMGTEFVGAVSAIYAGIYQWTINFEIPDEETPFQLKFGPSAWFANEKDKSWTTTVSHPDYTHVFLTRESAKKIRQSEVTLAEILNGLSSDDFRLRDEAVQFLTDDRSP